MAEPYSTLAASYDQAGLGRRTDILRQQLFNKIQMEGWLGRRVLDLGCGTGASACWFGGNGFRVTGVDRSGAMLAVARQKAEAQGVVVNWHETDIASMAIDDGYDLVLALDVFNEMRGIRELEAAIGTANRALDKGKLLAFDITTIQGFVEEWGSTTRVLYDDPDSLLVMVRSQYNYELVSNARQYTILRKQDGAWQRTDEHHILRAYALQAVGAIVQRAGFKVQQVLDRSLAVYDPVKDQHGLAIFIAEKIKDL